MTQYAAGRRHTEEMMKTLLPDLQVLHVESNQSWVVSVQNQYFSIDHQTALFVSLLKKFPLESYAVLAEKLSEKLGFGIPAADLEDAVKQLPASFFVPVTRTPRFPLQFTLLHGEKLAWTTTLFKHLFHRTVAAIAVPAIIALCVVILSRSVETSIHPMVGALVILISILAHEIGHATACAAVGAAPRLIGLGIRSCIPTFFTDVSDVWTKGRGARLVVDAGGVYFQLLYAGLVAALALKFPALADPLRLILLLIAFSALPYYRFDGYWFLCDLLGRHDVSSWLKSTARQLKEKLASGTLGIADSRPIAILLAYCAGFIALHIWMLWALFSSFRYAWNALTALRTSWNLSLPYISVELSIGVIAAIAVFAIIGYTKKARDIWRIAVTLIGIVALRGGVSFFHWVPRHRRYLDAVENAVRGADFPFLNPRNIAAKALIAKYYELIWYTLLAKLSTGAGMWLIKVTHRLTSRQDFKSIVAHPGPMILLAPHFGSFISGALLLLSEIGRHRPMHIFYADPAVDTNNAGYEDFYRRYFPEMSVLFDNKRGVIAAAKALQRGEIVVIMPDVFSGSDLVDIELLGKSIGVRQGVAYFQKKFNAAIVPIVGNFNGLFSVSVNIGSAIEFGPAHANESNASAMTRVFASLERWFLAYPEQWHCWERFGALSRPRQISYYHDE